LLLIEKKDPGEKFPWEYLAKFQIGKWHSILKQTLLKNREKKTTTLDKKNFFLNLLKIGYSKKNLNRIKKNKYLTLKTIAFQRRFRQELINGKIDKECLIISQNLAKKLS
jgi:N-acetylmuramoyl-L-alanine amidase